MILRCTATFLRGYDALPDATQKAVRAALQGFADSPLIPSHLARRINATPDVYALPFLLSQHVAGWITYQIDRSSHADDVLCVLRHVGDM